MTDDLTYIFALDSKSGFAT